jgi:hypothetical protein
MNIWLLSLGVLGIVGAGVWYAVLLHDCSPGSHVAFLTKGGIPTRSLYLWLLVVMLSESFVVNAFDAARDGFGIMGGVAVAFGLSEIGRWWHNRSSPSSPAEPPATSFPGSDRPDGAPSP